jgi:hypothetical protein
MYGKMQNFDGAISPRSFVRLFSFFLLLYVQILFYVCVKPDFYCQPFLNFVSPPQSWPFTVGFFVVVGVTTTPRHKWKSEFRRPAESGPIFTPKLMCGIKRWHYLVLNYLRYLCVYLHLRFFSFWEPCGKLCRLV